MGLSIHLEDLKNDASLRETFWPPTAGDPFDSDNWANLKTRFPIEYMMVLDHSGSMLSFGRWESAVSAANILANTLVTLRDPAFDDKVGVVTFSSNCSNHAPQSAVAKRLSSVTGTFPGDYIGNPPAIVAPVPNNCTPIGAGLKLAFGPTALDIGNAAKKTERVALLLSDGLHNSPPAEVPLEPGDIIPGDPCPLNWDPCPAFVPNVQVNVVAVGSDTTVPVTLLDNIRKRYAGSVFPNSYNISPDPEPLKEFFLGTLDDVYKVNSIPLNGGTTNQFDLNTNERRLIVVLSWDDRARPRTRRGAPSSSTARRIGTTTFNTPVL